MRQQNNIHLSVVEKFEEIFPIILKYSTCENLHQEIRVKFIMGIATNICEVSTLDMASHFEQENIFLIVVEYQ